MLHRSTSPLFEGPLTGHKAGRRGVWRMWAWRRGGGSLGALWLWDPRLLSGPNRFCGTRISKGMGWTGTHF